MIKITKHKASLFTLKGVFSDDKTKKDIVKKQNAITEFPEEKIAYIYLGKKANWNHDTLAATVRSINVADRRAYQMDVPTFLGGDVAEELLVHEFLEVISFERAGLYNAKTSKDAKKKKNPLALINTTAAGAKEFKKSKIVADARNWTRLLQVTPPNVLTSVQFAKDVEAEFKDTKNVSVKVLNKAQIKKLKMGLLLSVNLGSAFEPRVVVIEYKGKPSSKQKTVLVGKGITFDGGGYNIKTGGHMSGMKYDMSGAAIAAGSMKAIAALKPKSNYSIVLVMTDNMINSVASTPDAVFTSMNGKTVEINNTDAEGRLALADGITYAIRNLKATRVMDIATLTGAVISALGNTYSGVWTTEDKTWDMIQSSAKKTHENVWRLPFHKDYIRYMKASDVADLKNTDLTGNGGSSTAAMFLKEFTEKVEYVHFDVAGTADVKHKPKGVMVKTLVEMAFN